MSVEKREFRKIRIDYTGDEPIIDAEYGAALKVESYMSPDGEFVHVVERGINELTEIIGCYKDEELAINALLSLRLPPECEVTIKTRGMCNYIFISIDELNESIKEAIFCL